MPVFDYLIFADWPRGLYLAQKLAEQNKKIAYVECLPRLKNPFAFFLNEKKASLKLFLENFGFLSQQEGGLYLLSPQNIWPLQNIKAMAERLPAIRNFTYFFEKNITASFKTNWLSFLSLNLSAKIFENNNSVFETQGLNLLGDYFLFEPSSKKIEEFKHRHSPISFFTAPEKSLSLKKEEAFLSLKDKNLKAKKFICLSALDRISTDLKPSCQAGWQWQAYYAEMDFQDYKEIIPSHFLFLKNIYLPWCYDNLLSVFHRQGILEIWMKLKTDESSAQFIKQSENHLKNFFKGCDLKPLNKAPAKGFKVYGEERLDVHFPKTKAYIENIMDFFHGDLASEIYNEYHLFKKLT